MKLIDNVQKILKDKYAAVVNESADKYSLLFRQENFIRKFIFSCPVFEITSQKLQSLKWRKKADSAVYNGSNSVIFCNNDYLRLTSDGVNVIIEFDTCVSVEPALNGATVTANDDKAHFRIKSNIKYYSECNGAVAVFKDSSGKIFLTAAALYGLKGSVPMPVTVESIDCLDESNIEISCAFAEKIFFEINFYESKTVYDTIIESSSPDKNNVYGACCFLGRSSLGTQNLFMRFDPAVFDLTNNESLVSARVNIPRLNSGTGDVSVRRVAEHWCSFATTWNFIPKLKNIFLKTYKDDEFLYIDITELAFEMQKDRYKRDPGILLYCNKGTEVISTGDNYSAPVIIDLKIKHVR